MPASGRSSPEQGLPALVVRAQAGPAAGLGHLMRSLALAEEWRARGGRVELICEAVPQGVRQRLDERGVARREPAATHPDPADLATTLDVLGRCERGCWVAVDGYAFDEGYLDGLRSTGARLLAIADGPRLTSYPADLLLDANLGAEARAYPAPVTALQALGARFLLLRSEFLARRATPREMPPALRRLLVSFGGADPAGLTTRAIRALARARPSGLEASVVVGAFDPRRAEIRDLAGRSGAPVRVIEAPADMAERMASCDAMLGAAGSSSWEAAFLGLPLMLVVAAPNQRPVAAALAQAGAALDLGDHATLTDGRLDEALAAFCADGELRAGLATRARALLDGRGRARVVTLMRVLSGGPVPDQDLELRPAAKSDARALWRLANDPVVRQLSFRSEPIPFDTHEAWLAARLGSRDSRILVAELAGAFVGQLRYDRVTPEVVEVSFAVVAPLRGRGLGTRLLRQGLDAARALGARRVRGLTLPGNGASRRAFLAAGYREAGTDTRHGKLSLLLELEIPG